VSPLWLASASPRRRDLLRWSGYAIEVRPSDIAEVQASGEKPAAFAERLARSDGQIYGKPADREESLAFIQALSGRWHQVITGVCVCDRGQKESFTVTSEVRFRDLTPLEMRLYVRTGDGDDKAGAYGIQGRGGALIAEVRGSWTNVMGLPMEETIAALLSCGISPDPRGAT